MSRWTPGAQGRLQQAALQLFSERGFDVVTVAEIAGRAGVTERTFFRHFADKREVLFAGQEDLQATFVEGIRDAPTDATVLEAIAAGLDAGGALLDGERGPEYARMRAGVIAQHPALQERELLKLAGLSQNVAAALAARGVPDVRARIAGELTVSVFMTGFTLWIEERSTRSLVELQRDALEEAREVLSA